jgi:hypothetical protein
MGTLMCGCGMTAVLAVSVLSFRSAMITLLERPWFRGV